MHIAASNSSLAAASQSLLAAKLKKMKENKGWNERSHVTFSGGNPASHG